MKELSCFNKFTILAAEELSVMNTSTSDHVQPLCSHRFKGRLLGHIQQFIMVQLFS